MKKYLILFFVAAAAAFQSCDNNDDLWDAIDDLKSRVQALETQVDALNGNVEALQTLYNGGATISEVTESDGAYVIKLTDGTTLTLSQGSEAEAVIPVVSIDENGNWQYSVDGGKSFNSLGQNAVAEDGVTPQFRIDEETGYWQVYTTGEESGWTNVKNSAGQDVSAVGGEVTDKFFDSVRVDGDTLYIKLLGSEVELEVPIVADVLCAIVDAEGNPIEEIQMFDSGVERSFNVQMRGIDNTIVTAPEGWTARLTDPVDEVATLFVKAPGTLASAGTAATRATANTSQDVAILATSGKYSFISKIQVQSTGVEAEPPTVTSVTPSATVQPTDETLTFDVQFANADGWKYICQKSDAEAPDAAKVFAEGMTVLGTSETVEGLDAETEYTIYVVAYIGEQYSEVSTATGTTTAVPIDQNDYYEAGVTIEGVVYSKDSDGVKLLEATDSETTLAMSSDRYVYFLDGGEANNTIAITAGNVYRENPCVFIGRYADRKTKLNLETQFHLRNKSGVYGFKNLEIDMTNGANSQLFTFSNDTGGAKTLVFEDCDITFGNNKAIVASYSSSKGTSSIENIIFRNCKLKYVPGAESSYALIKLTPSITSGLAEFKTLIFENNILYTEQGENVSSAVSLFYQQYQDPANGALSNLAISCKNNTFVDFISYGSGASNPAGMGSAYFFVAKYGSVDFTKNVLYATAGKYVSIMRVTYDYNTNTPWPTTDLGRTENIAYGTSGWKLYFDGSNAPTSYYAEKATYSKKSESPLSVNDPANGKFVVSVEYAGYGSTLE